MVGFVQRMIPAKVLINRRIQEFTCNLQALADIIIELYERDRVPLSRIILQQELSVLQDFQFLFLFITMLYQWK